jgi:N-acetyl-anhydromuramyl-L-alanine amidase AmpD
VGLLVHHTAGRGTADDVRRTLRERGLGVQFIIDRQGNIVPNAPGRQQAHAGPLPSAERIAGRRLGNRNLEGVEVIALNEADVTPAQRAAVARLAAERGRRYGYNPRTNVWGHGELAAGRPHNPKEPNEGATARMIREGRIPVPHPTPPRRPAPGPVPRPSFPPVPHA